MLNRSNLPNRFASVANINSANSAALAGRIADDISPARSLLVHLTACIADFRSHRTLKALSSLSDDQLKDIGLMRSEVRDAGKIRGHAERMRYLDRARTEKLHRS